MNMELKKLLRTFKHEKEVNMSATNKHLEILGLEAKDAVTGFSGVITTISFDLYGCIQAVVTPKVDEEGKIKDGQWFDVTRLVVNGKKPVMNTPNFDSGYVSEGKKGCALKPLP